jgi:hypothetical protein
MLKILILDKPVQLIASLLLCRNAADTGKLQNQFVGPGEWEPVLHLQAGQGVCYPNGEITWIVFSATTVNSAV